MNYNDYDYILVLDKPVNEAITDPRTFTNRLPSAEYNPNGSYIGIRDPKLMASWAFGNQLQRELNNIGSGYSCSVFDCGGEVSVTVTHCTPSTGKSASRSFIIVFDSKSGNGTVKSSSTRWRTISGVSQAASYIKSVASSLSSQTGS